ncbi:AAA family ATPase [Roseateles sp. P5_E8]
MKAKTTSSERSIAVPQFPPHLLQASIDERIHYFEKEAVVDHPRQNRLLKELAVHTRHPTSRNLVLVIGGTGVGKSTLFKLLCRQARDELTDEERSAGLVGAVYLELKSPTKGTFNFDVIFRAILELMGVPLVDKTRPLVYRDANGIKVPTLLVETDSRKLTGDGLERRFYWEVGCRRPRPLILDEAKAIFKIAKARSEDDRLARLKEQSDLLKDLANGAQTTVMLGGGYDFFELCVSSAQTARRTLIIHVLPYDDSDGDDGKTGFSIAIYGLLCHLPIEHDLDPVLVATELFLQGVRCVGIAAGILAQALRDALVKGTALTMTMLKRHYYPAEALHAIVSELADGIKRVNKFLSSEDLLPRPPKSAQTPPTENKPLKVGDTKPSHLSGNTEQW